MILSRDLIRMYDEPISNKLGTILYVEQPLATFHYYSVFVNIRQQERVKSVFQSKLIMLKYSRCSKNKALSLGAAPLWKV